MSGEVTIGYYAAQMAPAVVKPVITIAPVNLEEEDDEILLAIIKRRGVDHVVNVAAAAEAAAKTAVKVAVEAA
jgi:hypothetical protein